MIDALYTNYIKEREGSDAIWDSNAFITYKITNAECFIVDMFVDREHRKTSKKREMMERLKKIAKAHACQLITANIHLQDEGAQHTLIAAMKLGFRIVRASNDILLISMDLGEQNNG